MYETIINPVNGTELNIYSEKGKEIVHKYTDHYNQLGGANSVSLKVSPISSEENIIKKIFFQENSVIHKILHANSLKEAPKFNIGTIEKIAKNLFRTQHKVIPNILNSIVRGLVKILLTKILKINQKEVKKVDIFFKNFIEVFTKNEFNEFFLAKIKKFFTTNFNNPNNLDASGNYNNGTNQNIIDKLFNLILLEIENLSKSFNKKINITEVKEKLLQLFSLKSKDSNTPNIKFEASGGKQMGGEGITLLVVLGICIVCALLSILALIVSSVIGVKVAVIAQKVRTRESSKIRNTVEGNIEKILNTETIKATEASYFTDNIGQNVRQRQNAFLLYFNNWKNRVDGTTWTTRFVPQMECIKCQESIPLPDVEHYSNTHFPYWNNIIYGKVKKSLNIRTSGLGSNSRGHNMRFKNPCEIICKKCASSVTIDTYFVDAAILFNILTGKLRWKLGQELAWGREKEKLYKYYKDISEQKFLINTRDEINSIEMIKEILTDGIEEHLKEKWFKSEKKLSHVKELQELRVVFSKKDISDDGPPPGLYNGGAAFDHGDEITGIITTEQRKYNPCIEKKGDTELELGVSDIIYWSDLDKELFNKINPFCLTSDEQHIDLVRYFLGEEEAATAMYRIKNSSHSTRPTLTASELLTKIQIYGPSHISSTSRESANTVENSGKWSAPNFFASIGDSLNRLVRRDLQREKGFANLQKLAYEPLKLPPPPQDEKKAFWLPDVWKSTENEGTFQQFITTRILAPFSNDSNTSITSLTSMKESAFKEAMIDLYSNYLQYATKETPPDYKTLGDFVRYIYNPQGSIPVAWEKRRADWSDITDNVEEFISKL